MKHLIFSVVLFFFSVGAYAVDNVPGRIQAENYVNYFDTSAGNAGGRFRNDNVDIETTSDTGSGYNVGWIETNEWLEYPINVTQAGNYQLDIRVASVPGNSVFTVQIGGSTLGGTFTVGATGGWQSWTTLSKNIGALTAGNKTLRIQVQSGNFNINWLELKKVSGNSLWTACANENQTCTLNGTKRVRYGAGASWKEATVIGSVPCNNTTFGDPISGVAKTCQTTAASVDPEYVYRFVWLIPTDKLQEYSGSKRDLLLSRMNSSIKLAQDWFSLKGNFSFKTTSVMPVKIVYGLHDSNWYETTGSSVAWNGLNNAANEVFSLHNTFWGDNNHRYRYVIWTNFTSAGAANGRPNFVVLSKHDMAALEINDGSRDSWQQRQVGGLAHEIGHTFGLGHEGDNDNDVMRFGLYDFNRAILSQSNITKVLNNVDNNGFLAR